MSTSFIINYLSERLASRTQNAIGILEAGVAAGEIKNALYIDAKDTVNRAMTEASERFLAIGPHKQKHHQSDWWLSAYDADAFLSGAHYLPSALKRAQKRDDLKEYAAFLAALSPLAALLIAAKPLVQKRQIGPQAPKTAKQMAREVATMTCQCCAHKYLANTGLIAHHGYRRPGHGWQTASCMGARHAPFEVERQQLAKMIVLMRRHNLDAVKWRARTAAGELPITRGWRSREQDPKVHYKSMIDVHHEFAFTSANFESEEAKLAARKIGIYGDWQSFLKSDLDQQDREIAALKEDIKQSQARFDGWVQTHMWKNANEAWTPVEKVKRIKA